MEVKAIQRSDPGYPAALETYLGGQAPDSVFALGNAEILRERMLALFCSIKCPGNLIMQTYDIARRLRDDGVTVISGFHSPMEKECLTLLLRGGQPVIWCQARRLAERGIPKVYAGPLATGRLLILSPFGKRVKRAIQVTALFRNEFVSALAGETFVAYAAPGGKTASFCRRVLDWGKPVFTFDNPENTWLLAAGAQPWKGSVSKIDKTSNRQ